MAGPPLKLWLYWSTRSTRTWRGTRTNMVATICWPPTSTTASACQLRNLQFPLQVSRQSVFEKRAWATGSHLVGHMAVYLLISPMWHFCSSISVSSWLANLRDAHAVCHHIESNSPAEQPAPVPLQEYQQLQPRPGQLTSFSWWRGAADHREQGESCCRWCVYKLMMMQFSVVFLREICTNPIALINVVIGVCCLICTCISSRVLFCQVLKFFFFLMNVIILFLRPH